MLTLLLALSAHAEDYRMNDVAGSVVLPAGWEVSDKGWTDYDFKAQSDTNLLMKLWLTPFQVTVDDAAAAHWAEVYTGILEREGLEEVAVASTTTTTIARRPTAISKITFTHKTGGPGAAWFAGFASNGQTIHLRIVGLKRNDAKAEAALTRFVDQLELDAAALPAATEVEGGGFTATLPDGWRVPHPRELDAVKKIVTKLDDSYAADSCFVGIRPPLTGDPDVVFACGTYLHVGPLDEHSFDGIEAEVNEKFFGSSATPVEAATPITVGDRMGFYYSPPIPGGTYRLALAPYDKGMMMTWAVANNIDEASLDTALLELTGSVAFTGPEGGQPIIAPDKKIMYYLKYRPTSAPVILSGLVLVGLIGGGIAMMRRRKPSYEIDDI
ncbi:MAG: hypothetical protein ACI8RZ_001794 [Myxococcota bacterium]|jgi:hypothetical protein